MTIRAQLAAAGIRAARFAEMPAHALLYLAAGLLRVDDLRQMSNHVWRHFNAEEQHLFGGLSPWEQQAFQRAIRTHDRVCIVGCGTGREVLRLLDSGHEVVGIEPSPEPVALLERTLAQQGRQATIIESFVEDAALPGMFDVFVFSNSCYSYIPGSGRRIQILRKLAPHLRLGGRIALWYVRRFGDWGGASIKLATLTSRIACSDMQWEPHDVVERVRGDGRLLLFTHSFAPSELEREAAAAGFQVDEHILDEWSQPVAILSRIASR